MGALVLRALPVVAAMFTALGLPPVAFAQDAAVPTDAVAVDPTAPPPRSPSRPPAAWPVRVHLALPLGSTFGEDHLQGFTWGFRGVAQVYPTPGHRGIGVGLFGELLLDVRTRQYGTWGAVFSAPIWNWPWVGVRSGASVGWRTRDDGGLRGDAVSLAAFVELVMPAYLYDLGLGLRVDATLDRTGVAAVSLLVDVDVAVLFAAFALAGAR
ncbi:MAG: hypothetical protein U0325_13555 [Polyangiales bacterium]